MGDSTKGETIKKAVQKQRIHKTQNKYTKQEDEDKILMGGREIFRTGPDRPWGPPSLLPIQWVPGLSGA